MKGNQPPFRSLCDSLGQDNPFFLFTVGRSSRYFSDVREKLRIEEMYGNRQIVVPRENRGHKVRKSEGFEIFFFSFCPLASDRPERSGRCVLRQIKD